MFEAQDHQYMARAMQLAQRGLYSTDPNPRVGCVLVRDGQVVGEGWHRRAGEGHAEVNALRQAGPRARGAVAYVTLEPCSHHGRTPPCSQALITARVVRVVVAMVDPNPRVAGAGLRELQQAGIEVAVGLMEQQAVALNPGFVSRMARGRPYVRCKLAMSLDGRTAMASGESRWITGAAARRDVHRLRARSSAIVTGIGTLLADDPCMDVRLTHVELDDLDADLPVPRPLRVVLDSRLRFPARARMLDLPGTSLILTGAQHNGRGATLRERGANLETVSVGSGEIDLAAALRLLASREVNEVLVEAGARLSGAFMRARLVDELVVYLAPHLMGDAARGLLHLPGLDTMAQRLELEIRDIRAVGQDWRICATLPSTA